MIRQISLPLLLALAILPLSAANHTVTTAVDITDPGDGLLSLREAISDAASGDTILFDLELDGATIATTGGTVVIDKNLTIDASVLPAGIRLDAALAHRLLDVPTGVSATICGASLLNGRTTNQNGGAVRCFGELTLKKCLVSGCIAGFGGGIFASGANAIVTLENCTFSGNRCRNAGTAMAGFSGADFFLSHCTLYDNTGFASAPALGAGAGGYFKDAGTVINFHHTIFGENRDSAGNIIAGWAVNGAQFVSGGYNLTDDTGGASGTPTDIINTAAMLGPLQYWGGLTACHRPLTGSPAIDAGDLAIPSPPERDGLAAPRIHGGRIDIGAVEHGISTFEQWCEHFGVTPDPIADDDSDGSNQLAEYIYNTEPDDAGDHFSHTGGFDLDGRFFLQTRINLDLADVILFFERSDDLTEWTQTVAVRSAAEAPDGITIFTATESIAPIQGNLRAFGRTIEYLGRPK